MNWIVPALFTIIALVVATLIGWLLGKKYGAEQHENTVRATIGSAQAEAERIVAEAKHFIAEEQIAFNEECRKAEQRRNEEFNKHKENMLKDMEALEAAGKQKLAELAQTEKLRLADITEAESRLRKKEEILDKRAISADDRDNELKATELKIKKAVKQAKKRIEQSEEILQNAEKELERIAELSKDEARDIIMRQITDDAKLEAAKMIKSIEEEAREEADKRSKVILSMAIQRYAGEYVSEHCVKAVNLPSDEVKGRIIGREGRNIRSIEAATGVDLIVDDTPETVVISAFDPIRREIAAQTLKRLIADGRIHPGRIEETVAKVTQEVEERIKEAGDQAFFELGLGNTNLKIIKMVGRLKYRTSYGQNIWAHSVEAAWLCGMMAAELGLDIKLARRCGLLHDIGKAMDHEQEGSHALIGADFLKKNGEDPVVVNAVAAHHEEEEPLSVYAHLTVAADALSGARPGARREILETYIKRLEDIEKICLTYQGVEKCYAIQAGREIRVLVEPDEINDEKAVVISHDIARQIEKELTYPGRIKVCVIRETRAIATAR